MNKNRIVSGITATGTLTLGNYLGAIKNFVKLQDKYEMFIFIADLHALTIDIDPEILKKNKNNIMALYLAAGLDPSKVVLFNQSDVLAHGTMSWIMETKTTIGELQRMTQFKEKSITKETNKTTKINTGILTYPALMAGDILLYNPKIVPIGIDQKQHIELTRNIAQRFNNKYGDTFIIPEPYIPKIGSKIMSLTEPTKKMSKSAKSSNSYISLLDDPEVASKKIMKAVTDSEGKVYFAKEKNGISNLLTIYASLLDISIEETEIKFKDANYGEFKTEVAKIVKKFLIDLQSKYQKNLKNIEHISLEGAKKANKVASKMLNKIKAKLGI